MGLDKLYRLYKDILMEYFLVYFDGTVYTVLPSSRFKGQTGIERVSVTPSPLEENCGRALEPIGHKKTATIAGIKSLPKGYRKIIVGKLVPCVARQLRG